MQPRALLHMVAAQVEVLRSLAYADMARRIQPERLFEARLIRAWNAAAASAAAPCTCCSSAGAVPDHPHVPEACRALGLDTRKCSNNVLRAYTYMLHCSVTQRGQNTHRHVGQLFQVRIPGHPVPAEDVQLLRDSRGGPAVMHSGCAALACM